MIILKLKETKAMCHHHHHRHPRQRQAMTRQPARHVVKNSKPTDHQKLKQQQESSMSGRQGRFHFEVD